MIVKLEEVPAEFKLNKMSKTFECEIHMVFGHKRFHPTPFIQIYGLLRDGKQYQRLLIKELGDELWNWFQPDNQEVMKT